MKALSVLAIGGCRPNFVKLGPLFAEMRRHADVEPALVHTGQHYDRELSAFFFRDLGLPEPDVTLAVGSGSQGAQTALLLARLEETLLARRPDLVLLVGDVNSTLAGALAAAKLGIAVAHVEAGLRSFDREMPEEINRVLTDALSDLLFVTERGAIDNLRREGIGEDRVWLVGNVMADALLSNLERIASLPTLARWGLERRGYGVLTLHRPENVDDPMNAALLVEALELVLRRLPVLFAVHPRTRERLKQHGLWTRLEAAPRLLLTESLGYLEFLSLVRDAALVLTDSGGLQEEATVLGVPCLTLRPSTERPATVLAGSNRVVGREPRAILEAAQAALENGTEIPRAPELWDGHAAERIVEVLRAEAPRIRELHRALRRRTACVRPVAAA